MKNPTVGKELMKRNSLKQQRISAELEGIIEEFGSAMRNAYRPFISKPMACVHDVHPRFSLSMDLAWGKYVEFCRTHADEKA